MPWWNDGSSWSLGWLMPVATMSVLALFALFLFFRWRRYCLPGGQGCGPGHSGGSALDTLRRRYARGEVNKEEFDRIRKDLDP